MNRFSAVCIAVSVALVTGCWAGPTEPRAEIRDVAVTVAEAQLVATVDVELDRPAAVEIEYGSGLDPRWKVESPLAASHRILLPRLRPDADHDYEVRVLHEGREAGIRSGVFRSSPLPPGLAAVTFAATGAGTFGLTMVEITGPDAFTGFVMVDNTGVVRWYVPTVGIPHSWERTDSGDFVLLDSVEGIRVVAPDGSVRLTLRSTEDRLFHHDMVLTGRGSILAIATERGVVADTTWTGEAIWEWDPDTDELERRWSAFDHLDPRVDRGPRTNPNDWLHFNSLSIGPRGNLLVSSPFLDQLLSIRADFSGFEWRLGGAASDFTLSDDSRFFGQHSATEVSQDAVVLFDNGVDRPDGTPNRADGGRYARAMELRLNRAAAVASVVWEFRPEVDNHAQFVSSAQRLPNGNTVVGFGLSDTLPFGASGIEVYEVTRSGEVWWHLRIDGPTVMYRATALTDIAGERLAPRTAPGGFIATAGER